MSDPKPLTPHDFPYLTLAAHCPVTCWACYAGRCGHGTEGGEVTPGRVVRGDGAVMAPDGTFGDSHQVGTEGGA